MSKALTIVAAAAAGSASGYFAASGAQQVKVDASFRAQSFELTDATGRLRGQWSVGENGAASFIMTGPTGGSHIIASAMSDGCEFTLTDGSGNPRLKLEVDGASPAIRVTSADGDPIAWISAEASGAGEIGVGSRASSARLSAEATGSLALRMGGNESVATLLAPANGAPSFALTSADRKSLLALEFDRSAPGIRLRQEDGGAMQTAIQAGLLVVSKSSGESASMRFDASGDASVELRSRTGTERSFSTRSP